MNDYKLTMTVGSHADDMLRLPCVDGCHKEMDGTIVYHVNCVNGSIAREGELLCQKQSGVWVVKHKEKGGEQ